MASVPARAIPGGPLCRISAVEASSSRSRPHPSAPGRRRGRAAIALADDRTWMRDALCAEPSYQSLPWIPERGVSPRAVREAKAVCARCLVLTECLACADALDLPGIWGGTTTKERRRARREAAG